MIRALIFDFDFTLGDSSDAIACCANYALRRLGRSELASERILPTIGLTLPDTFTALTGSADERERALFSDYFHDEAERVMVAGTRFYEGVRENLLQAREKGLKTAIVTTKHHRRIDQILAKFDASSLIDVVMGVEDVQNAKPHPEGLLRAIEALGLEKEDVLYIGDSLVDAQTALRAGAPFAAVLTGSTPESAFVPYPCRMVAKDVNEVFRRVFSAL